MAFDIPSVLKSVQVIANKHFEYTMLVLILLSCIELCFADVNVEPGSAKGKALYALDIFFTITFGIEVEYIDIVGTI